MRKSTNDLSLLPAAAARGGRIAGTDEQYDDSPWTREELQAVAWERVKHENWDEYDELPEQP